MLTTEPRIPFHQESEATRKLGPAEGTHRLKLSIVLLFGASLLIGFFLLGAAARHGTVSPTVINRGVAMTKFNSIPIRIFHANSAKGLHSFTGYFSQTQSLRPAPVMMGRADKRAAAKAAKKKQGVGRGNSESVSTASAANKDVIPLEEVKNKLREVPVFRISEPNPDGRPNIFLEASDAEAAAAKIANGKIEVVTLDRVYFDGGNVLQPSRFAANDLARTPQRMSPDVLVPVFFVDGMQVKDKRTGLESLPFFFKRSELLAFAATCMEQPEQRVMVADLGVLVTNMLQGPAGLLRLVKFFPTEAALAYTDGAIAEEKKRQALFPGQAAYDPDAPDLGFAPRATEPGIFPGSGGGGMFPGSDDIFPGSGGGGMFPN